MVHRTDGGEQEQDSVPTTSYEVWDALRVAGSGESRATFLDVIGYSLVGLAFGSAVGFWWLLGAATSFEGESAPIIAFLAVLSAAPWLVAAAFFLGFSALVRNSSRALTIAAVSSPLNDSR